MLWDIFALIGLIIVVIFAGKAIGIVVDVLFDRLLIRRKTNGKPI